MQATVDETFYYTVECIYNNRRSIEEVDLTHDEAHAYIDERVRELEANGWHATNNVFDDDEIEIIGQQLWRWAAPNCPQPCCQERREYITIQRIDN